MPAPREPSSHEISEISHDIDMLRGRVVELEREVDSRLSKMDAKIDEITRSGMTHHAEVMGAIANLAKSSELADQRNALQIEGVLANLKETTKRTDALEANRVDALTKLLDERKEAGRHWLRYVIASVVTIVVAVGMWLLGHFVK